jgi:hypothetical protein
VRQLPDGGVVGLARGQPWHAVDGADPHRPLGQAALARGESPHASGVGGALDGDEQFLVNADAAGREPLASQERLDPLRVDPQPEDLDERAASPDHLVQAVVGAPREVPGT